MKFLVVVTPRRDAPIPPPMLAEILKAQREWLQARAADGTFECNYAFPTGGGMAVVNVDSHEGLNELVYDAPAFGIVDLEAKALSDSDASMGNAIAALERAASMMPG
ncbi:MAG TPA: hypothetical protein VF752_05770 [Thermoleophilaceae bacterium]